MMAEEYRLHAGESVTADNVLLLSGRIGGDVGPAVVAVVAAVFQKYCGLFCRFRETFPELRDAFLQSCDGSGYKGSDRQPHDGRKCVL